MPRPETAYLRSLSGGWRVWLTDDHRAVTTLRYGLTVGPARRLHRTLYLRALFDDPRNPRRPLVTETQLEPWMRELLIRSPEVRGLRKGHRYSMRVQIFDDPGRTRLIGIHRESIPARFDVRADGSVSF